MNKKKSNNNLYYVFFVVIIIIIILVYLSTLGKVNLISHQRSTKNKSKWIEDRIFNLRKSSNNIVQVKKELNNRVKKYFQFVRITMVSLYFIFCIVVYNSLDSSFFERLFFILNITQVLVIFVLSVFFIRFDKPSDFKDVLRLIHLYIKNIVYRNYKNLDAEVKSINLEIEMLEKQKNNIQLNEIKENNG